MFRVYSIKKITSDLILLGRYNQPTGIFLLMWPCWWGVAIAKPTLFDLLSFCFLFALGSITMRAAGCAWNDLIDKDLDAKVKRTKNRPLAAKRLSISYAIIFIIFNSLMGLVVLMFLPKISFFIAIGSIPLIILYPFMKRVTWWPQLWLGLTFNWGLFVGWSCVTKEYPNVFLIIFYIGCILWTLSYDTAYALQDVQYDKKAGIKSSAVFLENFAKLFMLINTFLACLLWITGAIFLKLNILSILGIILASLLIMTFTAKTKIHNTEKCLELFKLNHKCAGLIFLSLASNSSLI